MKKSNKILATVVAVLLVSVLVFWFFAEDIYTIHSDDTVGQMVTTVDIPDSSYPVEIRIDGKPVTV